MEDGNMSRDRNVLFHNSRVVNLDHCPMKKLEYMVKISLAVVFAMLSWSALAATGLADAGALTDSAATVSLPELDGAVSFDVTAVQEPVVNQVGTIVPENNIPGTEAGVESSQGKIIDQELASLDVVDTGVLRPVQNPQHTQVVPMDSTSLEVVDTGVLRQVENPQPAEKAVFTAAENTAVLQSSENVSAPGEADGLNAKAVGDHQAKNYKIMLPMASAVEKNTGMDAVVAGTGAETGQPESASASATSEEMFHLPYAVLLAILALMSMIPVARRKG